MPNAARTARPPARRRAARNRDAALGDDPRKAVQRGLWLLSRSARSEHDLRERIERRFTAAATASALRRLRTLGYVDDRAWAAAYVERPRSLLRSARMLQRELRSHGVSDEIAVAATAEHDDDQAALARPGSRCGASPPPAPKTRAARASARAGSSPRSRAVASTP